MLLRTFFSLFFCLGIASVALAQVNINGPDPRFADSLQHHLDSLERLANINRFTDSLKINAWSDSLRRKVNLTFSTARINRYVDSLAQRGMPTSKVNFFKDSINQKGTDLLREINARQKTLQKTLTSRYESWTSKMQRTFNLDSMGVKSPALPGAIPGQSGVNVPVVPGLKTSATIPSLTSADFSQLALSPDLKQVASDYAIPTDAQLKSLDTKLPNTDDLMKPYTGQLGDVKNTLKDPGKTAEERVGQLAGVEEINRQAEAVNELKKNEAMQAADQLKGAESPEALLPAAVDHFAGKEVVLQQAMDQMAKYKEKYSSLPSMADVKKTWWPHNSLKGVPFKERFRVGLNLGVKNTHDTLFLDWHPNASYRISGRFEAGLGLMYRLRVQTSPFSFDQKNPVWGMTTFVVVKTFKSVFIRIETDGTSIPKTGGTDNSLYRDWRWSFLSGVQTNFRIATQWTGNVQMLYNFDAALKDKFPEQLVLRVGVQYRID